MPGVNTHSHNASHPTTEQDQDCLKAQRSADLFLFAMIGMTACWLAWLIISVIELA